MSPGSRRAVKKPVQAFIWSELIIWTACLPAHTLPMQTLCLTDAAFHKASEYHLDPFVSAQFTLYILSYINAHVYLY